VTALEPGRRVGFFTDTTVCIGCKACEVACKEWNDVPTREMAFTGESYDNTSALGADTWRHVAFIEQPGDAFRASLHDGGLVDGDVLDVGRTADPPVPPASEEAPGVWGADGLTGEARSADPASGFRWLMSSDVCKHCTTAACLDVCPTGSLFRTEFDTVVVQPDICNGCGYCVPACPYGVIDRREGDGRAWKCTLCYDRLKDDQEPACAKACPTDSINFGFLDDLQVMAADRLDQVVAAGERRAQLYGDGPSAGVDGAGSIFLLLDEPEVYGLPPDPIATTKHLPGMWGAAAAAAGAFAVLLGAAFGGRDRA